MEFTWPGFNARLCHLPRATSQLTLTYRFSSAEHILSRIAEQNIFKLHSEEKTNSFGRGRNINRNTFNSGTVFEMGEEGWRGSAGAAGGASSSGTWDSASSTLPGGILPASELPHLRRTCPSHGAFAQDRACHRSLSLSRPGTRPSTSTLGLQGMRVPRSHCR